MVKILIIEDDEDILNIISILLGSKYKLLMIHDTNNLLDKVENFLPDLIITDNFVGNKVAVEIISELRSEHRFSNIPVILLTGNPDIEKLSLEIAAFACLSKPFSLKDLNACIDKVLAILPAKKEVLGDIYP